MWNGHIDYFIPFGLILFTIDNRLIEIESRIRTTNSTRTTSVILREIDLSLLILHAIPIVKLDQIDNELVVLHLLKLTGQHRDIKVVPEVIRHNCLREIHLTTNTRLQVGEFITCRFVRCLHKLTAKRQLQQILFGATHASSSKRVILLT